MIFSDLYKSPRSPWSKLRQHSQLDQQGQLESDELQGQSPLAQHQHISPEQLAERDYGDADLVSRDKAKQKEAVRRFLASKIRTDWSFEWPAYTTGRVAAEAAKANQLKAERSAGPLEPSATFATPVPVPRIATTAGTTAAAAAAAATDASYSSAVVDDDDTDSDTDSDSDSETNSEAESVYSTISEDPMHFRPRAEWASDVSDAELSPYSSGTTSSVFHSPFRFDSPDSVGVMVKASTLARRARVRRDLRAEMAWNVGLACFTARRDEWTNARTVRIKPKPLSPASPAHSSPRRGLFRFHTHSKSEPAPAVAVSTAAVAVSPAAAASPAVAPTVAPDAASASSSATPTTTAATTAATITATSSNTASYAGAPTPLSPVTSNSRNSQQSVGQDTVTTTPLTSDGGGDGPVRTLSMPQPACASLVPLTPAVTAASAPARNADTCRHPEYAVETILPLTRPLLPPANPMRASISPSMYLNLYDKVVLSSLQPSCPINLADMMRACVAGWKRDGEWPPRPIDLTPAAAIAAARRKRREERQGSSRKERRNSSGVASTGGGGGGGGSSSFGRRMSNLLTGRPSIGSPPSTAAVLASPTKASAPAAAAAETAGAAAGAGAGAEEKDDDSGRSGIRRSLQRVLGIGSHGHSASVGSPPKE